MRHIPPLLVSAALLLAVALAPGRAAAATDEQNAAACTRQLREIGRALAAYQKEKGELPPHLSDLYPRYLHDKALFHCPADPTPGETGEERSPRDLGLPISYVYEMGQEKGGAIRLLGPGPEGPEVTRCENQLAQRAWFGDRVAVAECNHHSMLTVPYGDPPELLTLNLDLSGKVYRSGFSWSFEPANVAGMLARLDKDLTAGPESFRRHWRVERIGEYVVRMPKQPRLRDRLLATAAKLQRVLGNDAAAADGLALAVAGLSDAAGDCERAISTYEAVITNPRSGAFQIGVVAVGSRISIATWGVLGMRRSS